MICREQKQTLRDVYFGIWNICRKKRRQRVHKSWNATRDVSHHSGGEAKRSVLLRRLNSSQWWFYSYRRHTLIITHHHHHRHHHHHHHHHHKYHPNIWGYIVITLSFFYFVTLFVHLFCRVLLYFVAGGDPKPASLSFNWDWSELPFLCWFLGHNNNSNRLAF